MTDGDDSEKLRLVAEDMVLFQGDSITHAHRMAEEINDSFQLGAGYAMMSAARLRHDRPGDRIGFVNRGVCGDTTVQLLDRWQRDCLGLEPTVLSLLIGINDSTAWTRGDPQHHPDRYRERLIRLLEQLREARPAVRLVLLEPFALPVGLIQLPQMDDVRVRREMVAEVAERFAAQFVPLQEAFMRAADASGSGEYWIYDGIHPTAAGHRLIADRWLGALAPEDADAD